MDSTMAYESLALNCDEPFFSAGVDLIIDSVDRLIELNYQKCPNLNDDLIRISSGLLDEGTFQIGCCSENNPSAITSNWNGEIS